MKRASILGALAVVAGFFLAEPAAHATHLGTPPTPAPQFGCTLINDQALFPRNAHYYYCGATPGVYKFAASGQYGNSIPQHFRDKLYLGNVYLFVVESQAEDVAMFLGVPNTPGIFGHTGKSSNGVFVYTVVRESSQLVSGGIISLSQSAFSKVVIHEQGHALDFVYGRPSQNASGAFVQALNNDWIAINALAESVVFPHGIPQKRWTSAGWVNYTPPAVGTPNRNQTILTSLFPWFFDGSIEAKTELWASLYAQFRGANDFNFDNPYHPDGGVAGVLNGRTISSFELFKNFKKLTLRGATPKSYFDNLWSNQNFQP